MMLCVLCVLWLELVLVWTFWCVVFVGGSNVAIFTDCQSAAGGRLRVLLFFLLSVKRMKRSFSPITHNSRS